MYNNNSNNNCDCEYKKDKDAETFVYGVLGMITFTCVCVKRIWRFFRR